mgnify:CR=1 FL=1
MFKKIINYKYSPIIFFFIWFLIFLTLSFLRDSRLDENIYIGDSVEIANILQRGEWVGNYGIGLHGFLNKLLIGIIFIFTGPSVFIATFSNILFAIFSGVLFYRILSKHFRFSQTYALLGVTLLFCSYQFLMYTPTFYRDIPALFFVLLILDSVLSKKSKWLTGLLLLLLLDSKEHVFYTIAPAFVIWIGIESFMKHKGEWLNCLKEFVSSGFKLFLPSLIFLILMFTTSIIPLNIYNANILGLIDSGLEEMTSNFNLEIATYNRDVAVNVDIAKIMPTFSIPEGTPIIISALLSFINTILLYTGKILYPRTFSFLSIPFVILVPSIWCAFRYLSDCLKRKEKIRLILPIVLFVYLIVYIFHSSISRYILPISPIIFLFFLVFLRDLSSKRIYMKKVFIFTSIFVLGGLYFEYSYVPVKISINVVLLSVLLLIYFSRKLNKESLKFFLILIISMFFVGTSLLTSYLYGQIKGYRLYGYDRECEKIISLVSKDEKIWINDIYWDRLPFVLREENLGNAEWRWSLQKWVPKQKLLIRNMEFRTYNFYWSDINKFKSKLLENNINKVVYIKLEALNEQEKLLLQDRLEILLNTKWLDLEQKIGMKNKVIYLFDIDTNL